MQELDPELAFQSGHLVAQRRLGDADMGSSPGQAAHLYDGGEVPQWPQIEHGIGPNCAR